MPFARFQHRMPAYPKRESKLVPNAAKRSSAKWAPAGATIFRPCHRRPIRVRIAFARPVWPKPLKPTGASKVPTTPGLPSRLSNCSLSSPSSRFSRRCCCQRSLAARRPPNARSARATYASLDSRRNSTGMTMAAIASATFLALRTSGRFTGLAGSGRARKASVRSMSRKARCSRISAAAT